MKFCEGRICLQFLPTESIQARQFYTRDRILTVKSLQRKNVFELTISNNLWQDISSCKGDENGLKAAQRVSIIIFQHVC